MTWTREDRRHRVWPPGFLVSPNQGGVIGVEVEHRHPHPAAHQPLQCLVEGFERHAAAGVGDDGDPGSRPFEHADAINNRLDQ